MATGKGRSRPVDWHPLAAKDPISGDPEDIRDEVRKMKDTASTLRDQARILRKVADGDALQGKYADKIREKSGDLEKNFRETAARYERVVGDLGNWANDLEGFQERADGILKAAKTADEHHAAEMKKKEAEAEKDGKEKPEDSDPDSHLASYRRQLDDVISERDTRAEHYANNIGDDIKDVLKDSWWDDFKDWVHANADTIDTVCTVLSYAATIIGIVALALTPVGWLAMLITVATWTAVGLTVAVGIGHTMLALSGDGSWTDVAMDGFALATLGYGSIAMKGVKAAHTTLKTARFDRYANLRKLIDKRIMRYGANSERGQQAMRAKQALREQGAREVRSSATTRGERLLGGDKDVVNTSKLAKALREKYGDDAHIQAAADAADKAVQKAQINYGAASTVDLGDKAAEIYIGNDPYSDAKMDFDEKVKDTVKDTLTREAGSTWQHAAGAR